jgi:hypothetical protein
VIRVGLTLRAILLALLALVPAAIMVALGLAYVLALGTAVLVICSAVFAFMLVLVLVLKAADFLRGLFSKGSLRG